MTQKQSKGGLLSMDRLIEEVALCIDEIQDPNWYAIWGPNLSD